MPTVFDVLTSKGVASGEIPLVIVLQQLISATDFTERLGKQIYTGWLKSGVSWQTLRRSDAVADNLIVLISISSLDTLRLLDIANDCLSRDLHLNHVLDTILLTLRENVSTRSGDANYKQTSETIGAVCQMLGVFIRRTKSMDEGPEHMRLSNVISFALMKLSVARQIYTDRCIDAVFHAISEKRELLSSFVERSCKYVGFGYTSIARSLYAKTNSSTSFSELLISGGRIAEELVSKKCMRLFKIDALPGKMATVRKVYSDAYISAFKPSAFDLSLLLNYVMCDTLKQFVPSIMQYASEALHRWTALELLVIHMAFWNNIVNTDEATVSTALECLIHSYTNPGSRKMAVETIRFLAIQTSQLRHREEWRKKINSVLQLVVSAGPLPDHGVIMTLNGISPFYELNPAAIEVTIQQVQEPKRGPPRGSEECLDTLMQMIKRRNIVNRNT